MAPDSSDDDRKAALRGQIDENLRRIYRTAVEDTVPERFTRLLQQLREAAPAPPPSADAAPDPATTRPDSST